MDAQEGCVLLRGVIGCSGGFYGCSGGIYYAENKDIYSGHECHCQSTARMLTDLNTNRSSLKSTKKKHSKTNIKSLETPR